MASIRNRSGKWHAQVRRQGFPSQTQTFSTKTAAQRWARQIERSWDDGSYRDTRGADTITVSAALERYLAEVTVHKKPQSQASEKRSAKVLSTSKLGQFALGRLGPKDVAHYRDYRLQTMAPDTVRLEMALLSHVYTTAASEWDMVIDNPVRRVRKPSVTGRARTRRLVPGEYRRLLKAADHPAWLRPMIRFAIETAMRRSEIARMDWSRVDLENRLVVLPETKNGDVRVVPLSVRAGHILRKLWHTSGTPSQGPVWGITADNITHQFVLAVKRTGITNLRFHDLRHEATSRLFSRGSLNVMEVSAITGHKTMQMLKRYTHLCAKDLVSKLDHRPAP